MSGLRPLARLPRSAATRSKIAKALRGRKRPAEVREKIAASLRGRKQSDETLRKKAVRRALVPKKTNAQIIAECYRIAKARQHAAETLRTDQWRADLRAAYAMGDADLFADVKRSGGWGIKRKVFDTTGRVSHGVFHGEGKARWVR